MKIVAWLGALAALLGAVVLVKWASPSLVLSVFPGEVAMKPVTALCFISVGIALRHSALRPGHRDPLVTALCFFPAALMVLYLGDILTGTPGDALFSSIHHGTGDSVKTVAPGVPSVGVILGFILLGFAGYGVASPRFPPWKIVLPAAGTAALGVAAIFGYLLDVPALYWFRPGYSTALGLNTAVLFALVGSGFFMVGRRLVLLADTEGGGQ